MLLTCSETHYWNILSLKKKNLICVFGKCIWFICCWTFTLIIFMSRYLMIKLTKLKNSNGHFHIKCTATMIVFLYKNDFSAGGRSQGQNVGPEYFSSTWARSDPWKSVIYVITSHVVQGLVSVRAQFRKTPVVGLLKFRGITRNRYPWPRRWRSRDHKSIIFYFCIPYIL